MKKIVILLLAVFLFCPFTCNAEQSILSISQQGNHITISGRIQGCKNEFISFVAALEGAEPLDNTTIRYGDLIQAGNNGEFSVSFELSDEYSGVSADGKYQAVFTGENKFKREILTFSFINSATRGIFLTDLASSDNIREELLREENHAILEAIGFLINEYSGLSDSHKSVIDTAVKQQTSSLTEKLLRETINPLVIYEKFINDGANKLYENIIQYSDILNIDAENEIFKKLYEDKKIEHYYNIIKKSGKEAISDMGVKFEETVVSAYFNSTLDSSAMKSIIESYGVKAGLNLSGKYAGLSHTDKIHVASRMIGCGYTNYDEIISKFNTSLGQVNDTYTSLPPTSGGGGGRGISSTSFDSSYAALPEITPLDEFYTFGDMQNYSWAETAVKSLAMKKIIVGVGNNAFEPERNVTREEFAKMLALAFDLTDDEAECSFSDVEKERWSYTYIASLNEKSIIRGLSEESFAPYENLTRQDMGVMIFRVILYKNYTADEIKEADFADMDEISDYALESVVYLYNTGIVNGMPDGFFKPLVNTNRAQAAQLIHNCLEVIGGLGE